MRKIFPILLLLTLFGGALFAQRGEGDQTEERRAGEKKIIHLKSDLSGPVAPGDSVLFLVGNVAAQHNGAVITCDSAVRYSDTHVECFGNVLINKNTTYMYGDRADYDGMINEVQVYSDLVKVIDGEATLYTSNFSFNTKDNIGEFWGGGVLTTRDNILEAERGYYFSDSKELVAVEQVEMCNEDYKMKGDSVVYNTASDQAYFYENTHIWDSDGNFLKGDRGEYSKALQRYMVTLNGYLLTETQELWSDTLDYYRADRHVILRNNLQIDETEHKNLSFGDYGEFWEVSGNGFLTKNPALINYDTERNTDSIFMRSDSIYLYTLKIGDPIPNEYAPQVVEAVVGETSPAEGQLPADNELAMPAQDMEQSQVETARNTLAERSMSSQFSGEIEAAVAEPMEVPTQEQSAPKPQVQKPGRSVNTELAATQATPELDAKPAKPTALREPNESNESVAIEDEGDATQPIIADTIPADTLSVKERQALERLKLKEAARAAAAAKRAERAAAKKALLDSIAVERQKKTNIKLRAMEERDSIRQAERRAKAREKMMARMERDHRRGVVYSVDTLLFHRVDSSMLVDLNEIDRFMVRMSDSLDSLHRIALILAPSDTTRVVDSIYRFVKGFRNVRIYRQDFQAVCDSLTARSLDSTAHLYIKPVMWNETNQITSEVMDIYTANSRIDHVEFVGDPMMAAQFDTVYYDQITGKNMVSYFRDNEIYRVDVDGNVQTIFFQKDGVPQEVVMMAVIESGDASFFIEERQLARIVYRVNPVWPIYPIDGIPEDVSLYLKGFRWEGERRPTRNAVFNRTVRPSMRTASESKELPEFPLHAWIERKRAKLVEAGLWADRNDEVDVETVEWMNSLGFEVGQPR